MKNLKFSTVWLVTILFCMLAALACMLAALASYVDNAGITKTQDVKFAALDSDQQEYQTVNTLNSDESSDNSCDPEDDNPVVGCIDLNKKVYKVYQGSRGGLYIYRMSSKSGMWYKYYPNEDKRSKIYKCASNI
jgi:hypothetical protein